MPNSAAVGKLGLQNALNNKEETEKKIAAWYQTLKAA
jgi:hypothetical protein